MILNSKSLKTFPEESLLQAFILKVVFLSITVIERFRHDPWHDTDIPILVHYYLKPYTYVDVNSLSKKYPDLNNMTNILKYMIIKKEYYFASYILKCHLAY
jgi:hypothetical protein